MWRQAMQAQSMDALAQERDEEVRSILSSINDLAQIMKDLSTLVIDQVLTFNRSASLQQTTNVQATAHGCVEGRWSCICRVNVRMPLCRFVHWFV